MRAAMLSVHTHLARLSLTTQAVRRWWGDLRRRMLDGYRPEKHYMRGPGPKSRLRDEPMTTAKGEGAHRRTD